MFCGMEAFLVMDQQRQTKFVTRSMSYFVLLRYIAKSAVLFCAVLCLWAVLCSGMLSYVSPSS